MAKATQSRTRFWPLVSRQRFSIVSFKFESHSGQSQLVMSQSGLAGMAKLHIDLLGGCSARPNGDDPCVLPTRKSQALLAYLAVPAGRFHAREKLTAMFWGETPEAHARHSFRQALLTSCKSMWSVR